MNEDNKDHIMTVLLGKNLKRAFLKHCMDRGFNPSAMIRLLLARELNARDVEYEEDKLEEFNPAKELAN